MSDSSKRHPNRGIFLVFSSEDLDPDPICSVLEFKLCQRLRRGEIGKYSWNDQTYTAQRGVCKFELLKDDNRSMEELIATACGLLESKSQVLSDLSKRHCLPYLECCADDADLGVYFDSVVLKKLAVLGIELSVWTAFNSPI